MSAQLVRRTLEGAKKAGLGTAQYITLKNIPRTTTPRDLARLMVHLQVKGVSKQDILYDQYLIPTGSALLTLALPNFLRDNLRSLENSMTAGRMIHAEATQSPPTSTATPDNSGRHVVVSGFTAPAPSDIAVAPLYEGYEMDVGAGAVRLLPFPTLQMPIWSHQSRFLLRFASESEAVRFVQAKHQTSFIGEPIRTHVVYAY